MSDTPEKGPLSILEAVEALPEPEQDTLEADAEETPDVDPVESTEEETADPEPEAESEEADPPEESDKPQHLTIDEYGDLTIPVVIDGQERKVSLADAAKGYQLQSDYTRKSQALAEERKAMEAEIATTREALNRQQEQVAQLLASQSDPEPDWVKMAEEDPLGYVETKAKWDLKQAEKQRIAQEAQQRQMSEVMKIKQRETKMLMEKAPQFKDDTYQASFVKGVTQHFGFAPEEVSNAMDHRILMMAADALKWRESQSQVRDKVVVKSPKVIKPGAARGKAEIKAEQVAAKRKKLAKPHTIDEHINALFGE